MEFLAYIFVVLLFCGLIYFIVLMILLLEEVIKDFKLKNYEEKEENLCSKNDKSSSETD